MVIVVTDVRFLLMILEDASYLVDEESRDLFRVPHLHFTLRKSPQRRLDKYEMSLRYGLVVTCEHRVLVLHEYT